ncbi:MAG: dmpI4 [Clostridiales bacterium]|jgi:phenylpyruvate tautomerase PptA (4-oxalocrotonate tautomerase family)|nr:dmpI4 [Clostridiales bacterium]
MPLVKIEMMKGHTKEYKKTYLQAVHDALVKVLCIPDDDRFQRLYEIDADYFETNESKTDKFSIIELTLFPGRSKDIKGNIIKEIAKQLGDRLEIQPTDIFVIINEPILDNWGFRGEQASNFMG